LGGGEVEAMGVLLLVVLGPVVVVLGMGVYGEPSELKAVNF